MSTWSDDILATDKQAWDEVVHEESEKDPFFKKVWSDLATFRTGYQVWKECAFLPR